MITLLKKLRQKRWRLYDGNKAFGICDSYPQYLVVPENVKDDMIAKAAKFRDRCRFPALSCLGEFTQKYHMPTFLKRSNFILFGKVH